jgi:hypothetical protein
MEKHELESLWNGVHFEEMQLKVHLNLLEQGLFIAHSERFLLIATIQKQMFNVDTTIAFPFL